MHIAQRHLVPKLLEEHGLVPRQLLLPDAALAAVARGYTREAGVRSLSRLPSPPSPHLPTLSGNVGLLKAVIPSHEDESGVRAELVPSCFAVAIAAHPPD